MSERIGEAERRERPEGEGLAEGENPVDEITVLRNRKKLLKLQLKAAASTLKKQERLRRKALAKTKALTDEDLVWILRKRQAQ